MSTKFRQCFMLLCDDCRRSDKGQNPAVVIFGRHRTVKQILVAHRPVGGRTLSTSERVSCHHLHVKKIPEIKSLLAAEPPTQANEQAE